MKNIIKTKKMNYKTKIMAMGLISIFLFSNIILLKEMRFQDDGPISKNHSEELSENQISIKPKTSDSYVVYLSPVSASKEFGSTQTFTYDILGDSDAISGEWWIAIDGGAWVSQGGWALYWSNPMQSFYDEKTYTSSPSLSIGTHIIHARFYNSQCGYVFKDATLEVTNAPLVITVSPISTSKVYGSTQIFTYNIYYETDLNNGEWWIAIDGGAWVSKGAWSLNYYSPYDIYRQTLYYTSPASLSVGDHTIHARFYHNTPGYKYRDATITVLTAPAYQLSWNSPSAGSDYVFGPGDGELPFDFSYSQNELDDVKLFLNDIDVGSVWNENSINLPYNSDYDGAVTAVLKGYDGGVEKSSDSRNFNFIWVHYSEDEILEENYTIMPSKLYTIIHDPSGDGSTSTYEESHSFKYGVGVSMAVGYEQTFAVSVNTLLFGIPGGTASQEVSLSGEVGVGYDFEYEMTTSSLLTSASISDNASYIGPGYGDIYWGEGWIMVWQIIANHVEYYNGTHEYFDPQLEYGVNRSSEMILNSNYAPEEWKALNPALNNYEDVIFDETKSVSGGNSQTFSKTVTQTNTLQEHLTITYSQTTSAKLGYDQIGSVGTSVTLSIEANIHGSQEWNDEIRTSYTIADDDPGDMIIQEIGTDPLFGTPIFRLIEDSLTSNPLEHGSTDYLPPEIGDPSINYDSDGLSPSPSEGDSPLVQVHITDEGGVANAWVYYSTNNITFDRADLIELPGLDNEWEANIPTQEHNTTIYWYIRAGDLTDHYSVKKNQYNDCFTYNVVNRAPSVILLTPNDSGTYVGDLLISWEGSDPDMDDLNYSLEYSFDGVIWNPTISGLDNNSYLWDISGFGDQLSVVVRVIASDGYNGEGMDVSDYGFTIDNPDTPEVEYLAPLGGLSYSGIRTIEWDIVDIDNFVTSFDLEYSINSGLDWNEIVSGLDASVRDIDWDTNDIIFSEEVKIRVIANYEVESVNYYVFDISGIMIIDNRPNLDIDLISPNGGELFENEVMISWSIDTIEGVNYEVRIDYTTDGNTFTNIATGITENSYLWNTEDIPFGTNYRIRINITGEYMNYELELSFDISDGSFTIGNSSEGISGYNLLIFCLIGLFSIVFSVQLVSKKLRKK